VTACWWWWHHGLLKPLWLQSLLSAEVCGAVGGVRGAGLVIQFSKADPERLAAVEKEDSCKWQQMEIVVGYSRREVRDSFCCAEAQMPKLPLSHRDGLSETFCYSTVSLCSF